MLMLCVPGAHAQAPEGGADGAIEVVVGPGAQGLELMAIPDATCKGASSTACAAVSDILRRDMTLSFIFKVIPSRTYLADPSLGEVGT